ncbi:MAG: hypothetical protein AAB890_01370 [Patescibacteria group bacterium]
MKKIITIIIILAVLFIGFLIFGPKAPEEKVMEDTLTDTIKNDTINAIDKGFQQEIDIGDIDTDKEFESIEDDLQSL